MLGLYHKYKYELCGLMIYDYPEAVLDYRKIFEIDEVIEL